MKTIKKWVDGLIQFAIGIFMIFIMLIEPRLKRWGWPFIFLCMAACFALLEVVIPNTPFATLRILEYLLGFFLVFIGMLSLSLRAGRTAED